MVGNSPAPVTSLCRNTSSACLVLRCLVLLAFPLSACLRPAHPPAAVPLARSSAGAEAPPELSIAVVGTSDLHGYIEARKITVQDHEGQTRTIGRGGLALLGGYLENLRTRMQVLLLDGGDMFQGTMVSNLGEGQAVVDAYNALGYHAAAIGNHEFDFGPVGPRAVPDATGTDDPNGALKARAAAARFPFLSANLLDRRSGRPVAWPNVKPSTIVEITGIPLGIIGALTEDTQETTISLNLRDVVIAPILPAVRAEAAVLRAAGVAAVILTIHEGARCTSFANPRDLRPCQNSDDKVISLARDLDGVVDAVVAGHTHAGVAHFVGNVPVVQSFSGGLAFGRMDLTFRRQGDRWRLDRDRTRVHPPTELCEVALPDRAAAESPGNWVEGSAPRCTARGLDGTSLRPAQYEGRQVVPSTRIEATLRPHIERAQARSQAPLGVTLASRVRRDFHDESALAQLMADLIRSGASRVAGQPIDIALQNGGGIRNDLPAGPLNYGHIFEVQPFDNRLAIVRLAGAQLTELFRRSLSGSHGILVPSGLRVAARCEGAELVVSLRRDNGEPIEPQRTYSLAMSDFLATGGNSFAGLAPRASTGPGRQSPVTFFDDVLLRELIVEELKQYRGALLSGQMQPQRLILPAQRPLRCPLGSG